MRLNRRNFLQLGAAVAAAVLTAGKTSGNLRGRVTLQKGGRDFSPETGSERQAIPSSCWQCVTRDGIIGYVENGRLMKIEGNPNLLRTDGKLCARGQAGANQVYNPDRLLYPMVRTGERGQGAWRRISWDEALDLVVNGGEIAGRNVKGLKALHDDGTPEKFMFHYGRMKGSDSKIIKSYFLAAYGTGTIGNHTSICESAKWTAQELTWGKHYDNWDIDNTKFILNFGSNVLESHTNHIPMAQRCLEALTKGVKMYTFDVRLSNTAAKSTEWVPIKPATDLAVVLAMCNVLMQNEVYNTEFIETYTNVTVNELKEHLLQYTPEWAEQISGVPADKIRSIALEYGRTRPSVCISYRGAVTHYNGVQTERAIMMLEAIAGNIDVPGGRCRAVGAKWKYPFSKPTVKAKKLHLLDGEDGAYAYPTHHVSHQVLHMIDKGPERPEIYMFYCYNPVYANGDCKENIRILKDEEKIPFLIAVDYAITEASELADLILPDATYLERWSYDDMVSANQLQEYYIRQPMHPPLSEARNFCDVVVDLAKRLGLELGFNSAEEFVRGACENTSGVKDAGGFEYMKQYGAWYDKNAEPAYYSHAKEIDVSEAALDDATGVYYKKQPDDIDYSSLDNKHAAKQYVAQKCGDGKARKGFPPDKYRWKTGFFEIKSEALASKGFAAIPSWMPVPTHQNMAANKLVLTTFKVNVQTHSRTQNCKWLTEIYHDNPAWINPESAAERGIKDGDIIRVTSGIGEIVTKAYVTEGVHPGVVAISHHCGHWAYGEYASGKKSDVHIPEPDSRLKWWNETGVHPNWVIPNIGDPIGGGLTWMDTAVTVAFESAGIHGIVTQQINLIKGWNLISIGVAPESNSVSEVFPDALTVYAWENNTYLPATTIESGKAYWVAVTSDQTVTVKGEKYSKWTRSLSQGWHMIGALSENKPVSNLSPAPSILKVYGFDPSSGQYLTAATLEPGKGYWLAVSSYADISLSKTGEQTFALNKVMGSDFLEKYSASPPPPPDLNIADNESTVPKEYKLLKNYPNPFNPETTIKFELPNASEVTMKVYDVLGREVKTIVNRNLNAGYHSVKWNGTNDSGLNVSSGVYIYKIKAGNFIDSKKMLFLK